MTPLFTTRTRRSSSDASEATIGMSCAIGFPRSVIIHSCPSCTSRNNSLSRAFESRTPTVRRVVFAALEGRAVLTTSP